MVDFSAMANDARVPASTVREYHETLKDTFLSHEVPALAESRKRKATSTPKYCLFDVGLARHPQGRRGPAPGTAEYGNAFESFIFQEIRVFRDHHRLDPPRCWRSKSKLEVSFVFEDLAVEVKAKKNVGARDLKGLRALREEGLLTRCLAASMEPIPRVVDGMRILPWSDFLDRWWGGEWIDTGFRQP